MEHRERSIQTSLHIARQTATRQTRPGLVVASRVLELPRFRSGLAISFFVGLLAAPVKHDGSYFRVADPQKLRNFLGHKI